MAWYNRWWISPDAEIVNVQGQSHVDEIIREPEKFGTTRDHVLEVYQKHGERLGIEGHAREELMKEAMDKGWVRARDNAPGLYLETGSMSKYQNKIIDAIFTLVEKGLAHKNDPVRVIDWRTDEMMSANSFSDFLTKHTSSKKKSCLRLLKIV